MDSIFIGTAIFLLSLVIIFVLSVVSVTLIQKRSLVDNSILLFFAKNGIIFSWIIALCAFIGSNYYSEIVGYAPCKLCWWQRIFMFPLALLLLLAIRTKEKGLIIGSGILSSLGAIMAGYHYYGQILNPSALPCDAMTIAEACGYIPFAVFGFITVPFMAFVSFVGITLFILLFYSLHSKVSHSYYFQKTPKK
jgi:disulfide bond formation protein DsbB